MKTTATVEIPSVYARSGKVEVTELLIKAELDSNDDIAYLIYGQKGGTTHKTLIYHSRDLDEAVGRFNDLMLMLLNNQSFELKMLADERA